MRLHMQFFFFLLEDRYTIFRCISLVLYFPAADIAAMRSGGKEVKSRKVRIGQCFPNTMIVFDKAEGSSVNLVGKSKGYATQVHYQTFILL